MDGVCEGRQEMGGSGYDGRELGTVDCAGRRALGSLGLLGISKERLES